MRLRALAAVAVVAALALVLVGVVGAQRSARPANALFAVMNGQKEVTAEGERGAGDRNGGGSFSALFDGRRLCYGMAVKNIENPVAAHIHRGSRRVAGAVVVPLDQPTTGNPGTSSDCVEVGRRLARAMRRNPNDFYVNVHTADFPNGAVRGQLFGKRR